MSSAHSLGGGTVVEDQRNERTMSDLELMPQLEGHLHSAKVALAGLETTSSDPPLSLIHI